MTRFWVFFLMLTASAQAASNVQSSQTAGTATLTVMLPGGVPLELVRIPAGRFMMGSAPDPEAAYKNPREAPRHPVVTVVWIDGAKRGAFRVIRGGSYDSPAAHCRPAARYSYYSPSSHFGSWGLRVVMTK